MNKQKLNNADRKPEENSLSRRSFLNLAATTTAGVGVLAALGSLSAEAGNYDFSSYLHHHGNLGLGRITRGDVAVLKFLAAAELVEEDLWQQYCELAANNPGFNDALNQIDPALVRYVCDDRDDERSHAAFINSFLEAIGEEPANLDPFRILPSVDVPGAENVAWLTNLTNLTVDTSWYNRYRGAGNPDFGAQFDQVVNIVGRPTIPTSGRVGSTEIQVIAHSAAFHFAAIEQGGGSLYSNLLGRVRSPQAIRILAAIGPTEIYLFAAFHKSLELLFGLDSGDGLVFPDLKGDPERVFAIFPEPTQSLSGDLALNSIIRPLNTVNAGAVAAATGLAGSGLFEGQGQEFLMLLICHKQNQPDC